MTTKIPKILHIKGIHPEDCVTLGMFDNRLLINPVNEEVSVPSLYIDRSSWIKSVTRPCVNCTLTFDSIPIPIVIGMERRRDKTIMFTLKQVSGNTILVCSFECYINYIFEKVHNSSDRRSMLKMMEFLAIEFGVHKESIQRGKSHEELDVYGGPVKVKKYKDEIQPVYW